MVLKSEDHGEELRFLEQSYDGDMAMSIIGLQILSMKNFVS